MKEELLNLIKTDEEFRKELKELILSTVVDDLNLEINVEKECDCGYEYYIVSQYYYHNGNLLKEC